MENKLKYPKFLYEKGRKVVCSASESYVERHASGEFTSGKIYVSKGLNFNYSPPAIAIIDDTGYKNGWRSVHFTPIAENETEKVLYGLKTEEEL
jgi:hypothetical protein